MKYKIYDFGTELHNPNIFFAFDIDHEGFRHPIVCGDVSFNFYNVTFCAIPFFNVIAFISQFDATKDNCETFKRFFSAENAMIYAEAINEAYSLYKEASADSMR